MKTIFINRITLAAIAVVFSAFLFTSCQKENSTSGTDALTADQAADFADESTQADASFSDVEDLGMIAAEAT